MTAMKPSTRIVDLAVAQKYEKYTSLEIRRINDKHSFN